MKLLLLVSVCVATCQAHQGGFKSKLELVKTNCNSSDGQLHQLFQSLSSNDTVPNSLKTLSECWLRMDNLTLSDNTLNLTPMKDHLLVAASMINDCNIVKKVDNIDTSYAVFKCVAGVYKYVKSVYI
ncbi:hypothetical protein RN001_014183 [Aquatica leii]|uniref:Uncharacterized protein n=1 Tax=Aquatica leii TaxID=1421715 RepID=A0AAN7P3U2_9COLE|nr:hypothetical protein RN001_014183 [Aquatica leii]